MIAPKDPQLRTWLTNAQREGDGFLTSIATAALLAHSLDYELLRPVLLELQRKYPRFGSGTPANDTHGVFAHRVNSCPRCGHVHEAQWECGADCGGGGVCRCNMEVPA